MTSALSCPSCGAPLEVKHRFIRVVACAYCGQTSTLTPAGLEPGSKAPTLVASESQFAVGRTGKLRGEPCAVLGRLRYGYDGGFWDEWLLRVGDAERLLWLQEDDGTYTLFDKAPLTSAVPDFDDIRVGSTIQVNDRQLFITERTEAMILGLEGALNFRILPGADVFCVDGNSAGETWSLEYTPEEITLSRGEPLGFDEVRMDD